MEYTTARILTGIPRLDAMLGGKGYYRGSSIIVTGTPGTGKTSLAATFTDAACRRRERCLYIALEGSQNQIFRNMRSIGIDLKVWATKGLLRVHAGRPTAAGLETHLLTIQQLCQAHKPKVVVIDPISNLIEVGNPTDVKAMLSRLTDYFKSRKITTFYTSLVTRGVHEDSSGVGISSIMDTWLQLEDIKNGGEHNRGIFILKSRGMPHSNQIREVLITDRGIQILDVPISSGEVRMGSARVAMEAREREEERERREETDRKKRLFEQKRLEMEARIAAIEEELSTEAADLKKFLEEEKSRREAVDKKAPLAWTHTQSRSGRPGRNRKKTGAPRRGR